MRHRLRPVRRWKRLLATVPPDLAVVAAYVVGFDLVVATPLVRGTPLRPVLALPLLFFLPGYVLVAALFPAHGGGPPAHGGDAPPSGSPDATPTGAAAIRPSRRIDLFERAALSFGASVAVLPWFGLLLAETPWGFRSGAVLGGLSALVLAGAAVGTVRRRRLPAAERFRVPWRRGLAALRSAVVQPARPVDAVVNAALLLSVVVALSALVYGLSVPNHQAAYTDFYLVTEDENGTAVAAGYPTDFTLGEGQPVTLGVRNREGRPVVYGIVVELQRVRLADGSATVLEERELVRLRADVAADETWTSRQSIVPELAGEDLRLQFYLYKGDPPSDPDPATAYHQLYLWIDVSEPNGDRAGVPVERSRN